MATPHKVAFHTLGCKLNFSETSTIRQNFENKGYQTVSWDKDSDIYILNTCSVTEHADKKCRAEVRKIMRKSPEARIVIIGCYAQLKPKEIAEIPGVDLVLGAAEKFNVEGYIEGLSKATDKGMVHAGHINEVTFFEDSFSFGDRTRTFLKVQDGCDYKCTFCTIPQARGKSRSSTIKDIVTAAQKISSKGVKEIVLTGVNTGDFGKDSNGKRNERFIDLIKELDQVSGIERFRISSIEPNLCSEEIIEFVASSQKFVPHFHMPLQSGSDRILALMKRRYRTQLFSQRVQFIKNRMPDACIGVDVIVGFPGESDEDFAKTFDFLSSHDISYLHTFTYSERKNTPAAFMQDVVPIAERRKRSKSLRELSLKMKMDFYKKHIGSSRNVLIEKDSKGRMTGFTDNYIKVHLSDSHKTVNQVSNFTLEALHQEHDLRVLAT